MGNSQGNLNPLRVGPLGNEKGYRTTIKEGRVAKLFAAIWGSCVEDRMSNDVPYKFNLLQKGWFGSYEVPGYCPFCAGQWMRCWACGVVPCSQISVGQSIKKNRGRAICSAHSWWVGIQSNWSLQEVVVDVLGGVLALSIQTRGIWLPAFGQKSADIKEVWSAQLLFLINPVERGTDSEVSLCSLSVRDVAVCVSCAGDNRTFERSRKWKCDLGPVSEIADPKAGMLASRRG